MSVAAMSVRSLVDRDIREKVSTQTALTSDLSIRHLLDELAEIVLGKVRAGPLQALRDLVAQLHAPIFFELRLHGIGAAVQLRIQKSYRDFDRTASHNLRHMTSNSRDTAALRPLAPADGRRDSRQRVQPGPGGSLAEAFGRHVRRSEVYHRGFPESGYG